MWLVAVLGYRAARLPVLAWLCLLPGSSGVCICVGAVGAGLGWSSDPAAAFLCFQVYI